MHIHVSLADEAGKEYGGHFKDGNRVLTTVELVIGEIDKINMSRRIDPERGVPYFVPEQM